tara:strand:+ start:303 stop:584 length:282 start_codon:yes stop_codon:yes gene_type:complete
MTQYMEQVFQQKLKLEAEAWANTPKCLHSHQLKSMWYDNRPQDTDESPVLDIQYNDGRIERTIIKTGEKVTFETKQLTGEELVYEYQRCNPAK